MALPAPKFVKPPRMEQSFFDALMEEETPPPLITYMAEGASWNLQRLRNYCHSKQEVVDLLVDAVDETRGKRKWAVAMCGMWAQ